MFSLGNVRIFVGLVLILSREKKKPDAEDGTGVYSYWNMSEIFSRGYQECLSVLLIILL